MASYSRDRPGLAWKKRKKFDVGGNGLPRKIHITEEMVSSHFMNLTLSDKSKPVNWLSTSQEEAKRAVQELDSRLNPEDYEDIEPDEKMSNDDDSIPRFEYSQELKDHLKQNILQSVLLAKKPCMELVLWKPPPILSSHLLPSKDDKRAKPSQAKDSDSMQETIMAAETDDLTFDIEMDYDIDL